MPDTDFGLNITPVDVLSIWIVKLGESEKIINTTINLTATHIITLKAIWAEVCRQKNMQLCYVDMIEWRQKLNKRLETDSQSFQGLYMFSSALTASILEQTTTSSGAESDLNLPMFVKVLLQH